ncbi:unnamed protein product [Mucor circinelloides]
MNVDYPPQPALANQDELLTTYVQQMEAENHTLKQQMDLLQQTTHEKLLAMEQRFDERRMQYTNLRQEFTQVRQHAENNISSMSQQSQALRGDRFKEENIILTTTTTTLQEEHVAAIKANNRTLQDLKTLNAKYMALLTDSELHEGETATLQSRLERLWDDKRQLSERNDTYRESILELKQTTRGLRQVSTDQANNNSSTLMADQAFVASDYESSGFRTPIQVTQHDGESAAAASEVNFSSIHVNSN